MAEQIRLVLTVDDAVKKLDWGRCRRILRREYLMRMFAALLCSISYS